MARCLVTGHKGYIGSKLYARLQSLGHKVIGIDLNEKVSKDINKILVEDNDGKFHPHFFNFQPEYIFHMACLPRVGFSVEHPVETTKNNIIAGTNILNFARKVGSVKRVIYSSSSSVVGNGNGPTSPYALQKFTTELETTMYSHLYGLDTVSLRYFNVYSHDQPADGPYATAVANWMKSIREGINPFITGDGEQRRDMVNVDDVVEANIFCMNYEKKLSGSVFDVGTGANISLNEISEIVKQHFPNVIFDYVEPRNGDVMITKANISGLAELGWLANIEIREGISDCFRRLR
jgi:UDP-glucose 4-epimerase